MQTWLTLPAAAKEWRAWLEGSVMRQVSRTGNGRPRETSKRFQSRSEAQKAYEKAVSKKRAEGFLFVRSVADAAPGDLVLDLQAPNGSAAHAFDLAPDGRTIALATTLKGARGAQLSLVDVDSGRLRSIHEEPSDGGQTFLHAVLFDASATAVVYAMNGETRRLDLATAKTERLASFEQSRGTRFNPFCVRPSWDGARRRLLVFDAGDLARVLDSNGSTLLEVSTASATNECRSGALSRSGRLLALYRSSRYLIYGHEDARNDTTNWVEVWDVDAQTMVRKVPVTRKIATLGFDPSETMLLSTHDFVQGPGALSIETGQELWHLDDADRSDRWGVCFCWGFAPDGHVLAVGGFGLRLFDAVSRRPAVTQPAAAVHQRVKRIVYSADGALVACGGDRGRLQLFKG